MHISLYRTNQGKEMSIKGH